MISYEKAIREVHHHLNEAHDALEDAQLVAPDSGSLSGTAHAMCDLLEAMEKVGLLRDALSQYRKQAEEMGDE